MDGLDAFGFMRCNVGDRSPGSPGIRVTGHDGAKGGERCRPVLERMQCETPPVLCLPVLWRDGKELIKTRKCRGRMAGAKPGDSEALQYGLMAWPEAICFQQAGHCDVRVTGREAFPASPQAALPGDRRGPVA